MTLTNFDPRTLVTRKKTVHPLSDLDSYLMDMESTCAEMQAQILDDAYRTEDGACLRDAAVLIGRINAVLDALMEFQREYVG